MSTKLSLGMGTGRPRHRVELCHIIHLLSEGEGQIPLHGLMVMILELNWVTFFYIGLQVMMKKKVSSNKVTCLLS